MIKRNEMGECYQEMCLSDHEQTGGQKTTIFYTPAGQTLKELLGTVNV